MEYEIKGGSFPIVICKLQKGETMKNETGAMAFMSSDMKMDTNTGGGLLKGLGRALSGDTIFLNFFTAQSDNQEIGFAARTPGKIMPIRLNGSNTIIGQKNAFLAAEDGVNLDIYFRNKLGAGIFGGEGFILQKFTGTGIVFLEIDGEVIEHDPVDSGLLVQTADHDFLVDGLIIPADKVIIEVYVEIIHVLNVRHGIKHIDVIHIEAVLGKTQPALPEQVCSVDHRMHEDILSLFEMSGLIPAEHPVPGKRLPVLHDLLVRLAFLVIYKIADEQIDLLFSVLIFPELIQNALISARLYLVITVDDLEIHARRILDPCIYSSAVPLIGLVDRPHDPGIPFL